MKTRINWSKTFLLREPVKLLWETTSTRANSMQSSQKFCFLCISLKTRCRGMFNLFFHRKCIFLKLQFRPSFILLSAKMKMEINHFSTASNSLMNKMSSKLLMDKITTGWLNFNRSSNRKKNKSKARTPPTLLFSIDKAPQEIWSVKKDFKIILQQNSLSRQKQLRNQLKNWV